MRICALGTSRCQSAFWGANCTKKMHGWCGGFEICKLNLTWYSSLAAPLLYPHCTCHVHSGTQYFAPVTFRHTSFEKLADFSCFPTARKIYKVLTDPLPHGSLLSRLSRRMAHFLLNLHSYFPQIYEFLHPNQTFNPLDIHVSFRINKAPTDPLRDGSPHFYDLHGGWHTLNRTLSCLSMYIIFFIRLQIFKFKRHRHR